MTWEIGVVAYLLAMLTVYPISSVRLNIVDVLLMLGAGGLLVIGFFRLIN